MAPHSIVGRVALSPTAPAPLLAQAVESAIVQQLSGGRARRYVARIIQHHRVQASQGFRDAALYLMRVLRRHGLSPKMESAPSDGFIHYLTFRSPIGWQVEGGELWLVEPLTKLADYADYKDHLVTLSRTADVTAEVVDVGTGQKPEDYEGKEVQGKIVLASGYGGTVHREAVIKRGALGVIVYPSQEEQPDDLDIVKYTGMWPAGEEREKVTFGFNISRRAALLLQGLMQEGKTARVHAVVRNGVLMDSTLDTVAAVIQGREKPNEEILLVGHLDHPQPSANDNASGSAVAMEVAAAFQELIRSGVLPAPRRSLRFVWPAEFHGTAAWVASHPECAGRILAGLNLDMVGEDVKATDAWTEVSSTPNWLPSFMSDFMPVVLARVAELNITDPRGRQEPFRYRLAGFQGGSDHLIFSDPTVGAACVMMSRSPDRFWHTTKDTLDKVDATELRRSAVVSALTLWFLANAGAAEAEWLAGLVEEGALRRLREAEGRALTLLDEAEKDDLSVAIKVALNLLWQAALREQAAAASVLRLSDEPPVQQRVSKAVAQIEGEGKASVGRLEQRFRELCHQRGCSAPELPLPPDDEAAARIYPQRLTLGIVNFGYVRERIPEERGHWYDTEGQHLKGQSLQAIAGYAATGRSVSEIRDAVAADCGELGVGDVLRVLEDMENAGVLRLERSNADAQADR